MRTECRIIDEPLVNLPDTAVVALVHLERIAPRLGPRQVDVTRQVPQDGGHLVIARADQLSAEYDLRRLLTHDMAPSSVDALEGSSRSP